jgi:hypothetical protein
MINILGLFQQRLQGFEQDVTNTLKMNYETGMYVCMYKWNSPNVKQGKIFCQ